MVSTRGVLGEQLDVFTPYGPMAASTRVRVLGWLRRTGIGYNLEQYASTRTHQPLEIIKRPIRFSRAERRVRSAAKERHQRVLVQRQVSPFSGGTLERRLALNSDLFVYDFDDALMNMPRSGSHRIWSKADSCISAVQNADRVIAGSHHLADWASKFNRDVRYIPTCVDVGEYEAKSDYEVGPIPRLVWLGSPATEYNLSVVEEQLLAVHRITGARLSLVSSGDRSLGKLDLMIDRVPWTPEVVGGLRSFDLGLAPLLNGPFERGKCAYKVLQYAAAGLPVVGSPVGANQYALRELGLVAPVDSSRWTDAILSILEASGQARRVVGEGARRSVADKYGYESWQKIWLDSVGQPR